MNFSTFMEHVQSVNSNLDLPLLERAYRFSDHAHQGQLRKSGHPYVEHCLEVAAILAELHMDTSTVVAGIIHDVIEDTKVTKEQLAAEFNDEIALLVDGLTKISELPFTTIVHEQAENYRKMILSMTKDIRVVIIKLADRLHNMRTLEFLEKKQIERIAKETAEIYAPLAHRFGIAKIKWELEDLVLKHLEPKVYNELAEKVAKRREERERYIEEVKRPLMEQFAKSGINAEITGRPKHFYSIYQKMKTRGKTFEEIYDLLAIRIITDSVKDCYHTLGIIHSIWRPVFERIKDYIAAPKSNMYQSLHTTVIGPRGEMVEIQIRTKSMHRTCEEGIAAHWRYKEGVKSNRETDEQFMWLRHVMEWQQKLTDPKEFMEYLKVDLYHDEVFVFTPKGDLKQLPLGATPLDFAFAVHTDIGLRCTGAKVNGRLVPLRTELKNGDVVEILTASTPRPSRGWFKFVKTSRAKAKIRHWLKGEEYLHSVELGKQLMDHEVKRLGLREKPSKNLVDITSEFSMKDINALYAAIGRGELSAFQVLNRMYHPNRIVEKLVEEKEEKGLKTWLLPLTGKSSPGIKIQGVDNIMLRFARCCQPVPGDPVIGYITRGRGISIHRVECQNVHLNEEIERKIHVEWDIKASKPFTVCIEVLGRDRKDLLADITRAIADAGVRVCSADIHTENGMIYDTFLIEVRDVQQLHKVIKRVKRVKSITNVERKEIASTSEVE